MEFVDDRSSSQPSDGVKDRIGWLRKQEIPKTALRGYLKSKGYEQPPSGTDVRKHIAESFDEPRFEEVKDQFRFGGKKSLNYFVVTGVSDDFDLLEREARAHFPIAEEVEGEKGKPYLTRTTRIGDRLYLIFGHYVTNKTHNPETGEPVRRMFPDECVAVINPDADLVEVRTADTAMARKICYGICDALDMKASDDTVYKPDFGSKFQEEFNDFVEKYINLKVRVREGSDGNVGTIKFSSRKGEDEEYKDVRDDDRVQRELDSNDGEISNGYVELADRNFAFEVNRPQSKLWVRRYEREENLNKITNLIDNVLRQSGGYSQSKLQGFGNVPE
jgi:hypothetical protein